TPEWRAADLIDTRTSARSSSSGRNAATQSMSCFSSGSACVIGWSQPRPWRRDLTGDAVDHGVGGRETRRDLVVAGLAQHDPGDRRPLAVDPADGPEGE